MMHVEPTIPWHLSSLPHPQIMDDKQMTSTENFKQDTKIHQIRR